MSSTTFQSSLSNSHVEIDLKALRHNISVLQGASRPARLMGVVKANAYGHGARIVSEALVESGVEALAVATLPEAIELRGYGFEVPILVLGAPLREHFPAYEAHNLDLTVASLKMARELAEYAMDKQVSLRAHAKVDTGMGRLGCRPDELADVLQTIEGIRGVTLNSIWTHFAQSSDPSTGFSRQQIDTFREAVGEFDETADRHIVSSHSLITVREGLDLGTNGWARIGVALYGMLDQRRYDNPLDLRPVMRWTSRLVQIKVVEAGTSISYGRRWVAERRSVIGTVSAGYADGYPRKLSNRGEAGIGGERYPVAGTVCMDMFMLDLGPAENMDRFNVGDEVVLMGPGGPAVVDLADWAETISYEITTGIASRAFRSVRGG